jgi:hypothetical protein
MFDGNNDTIFVSVTKWGWSGISADKMGDAFDNALLDLYNKGELPRQYKRSGTFFIEGKPVFEEGQIFSQLVKVKLERVK